MSGRPNPPRIIPAGEKEVLAELRRRIEAGGRGEIKRIADEIGVSHCRISAIARGYQPVTDRIAAGLGFRKTVAWERVR